MTDSLRILFSMLLQAHVTISLFLYKQVKLIDFSNILNTGNHMSNAPSMRNEPERDSEVQATES